MSGGSYVVIGQHQGGCGSRDGFGQTTVNLTVGRLVEQGPVHVRGTTTHGVSSNNVLTNSSFDEIFRSENLHFTTGNLSIGNQGTTASNVIDVRVSVDDVSDWVFSEVGFDKLFPGGVDRFETRQRVDNQPSSVSLDERHDGQIVSTDLVNGTGNNFEQTVKHVQLCHTPEGRVDRFGSIVGGGVGDEAVVLLQSPSSSVSRTSDVSVVGQLGNEPALSQFVIVIVGPVELFTEGIVGILPELAL